MRSEPYRILADEDVASVVVYLRSLPPIENPLPARSLSLERLQALARRPEPLLEPVPTRDLRDPVERGRYLIHVSDCVGCHTSWYTDQVPGGFSGGNEVDGVFSTNITHDSSGIRDWGAEAFVRVIRTGKGGTLDPAMPWVVFRGMTDEDLGAVYLALGAAPPIRHWIDNAAPPTYCPVCGQMHGLGERNMALRHAAVPISADVLSAYEGRYVDEMGEDTVLIRVDDETLWVVATGEDPQ
jgi:hypothetical protein